MKNHTRPIAPRGWAKKEGVRNENRERKCTAGKYADTSRGIAFTAFKQTNVGLESNIIIKSNAANIYTRHYKRATVKFRLKRRPIEIIPFPKIIFELIDELIAEINSMTIKSAAFSVKNIPSVMLCDEFPPVESLSLFFEDFLNSGYTFAAVTNTGSATNQNNRVLPSYFTKCALQTSLETE